MKRFSLFNFKLKNMSVGHVPMCASLLLVCGTAFALTNDDRIAAAQQTVATNPACTSLTSFWWEVGDQNGKIWGGPGGDNSDPTQQSEAADMQIASASKWIFGAYTLQELNTSSTNPLTGDQVQYLNFTSGYDNLSDLSCNLNRTVSACFTAARIGGHNNDRSDGTGGTSNHIGAFSYNGGHLQGLAVSLGLGGYYDSGLTGNPKLATEIMSQVGQAVSLSYQNPNLAGGVKTQPRYYRQFLQSVLSGSLRIKNYLDANQVCAWTGESNCNAVYSPVTTYTPSGYNVEHWYYSLAHWVEGPTGDYAYSSPGAYGFYPWIDSSKTYYGMVAHQSSGSVSVNGKTIQSFAASAYCGRMIRRAWATGIVQTSVQ